MSGSTAGIGIFQIRRVFSRIGRFSGFQLESAAVNTLKVLPRWILVTEALRSYPPLP